MTIKALELRFEDVNGRVASIDMTPAEQNGYQRQGRRVWGVRERRVG